MKMGIKYLLRMKYNIYKLSLWEVLTRVNRSSGHLKAGKKERFEKLPDSMKERLGEFQLRLYDIRQDSKDNYVGRVQWWGEWLVQHGIKQYEKAERKHIDQFLSGYDNVNTRNLFIQVLRRFYKNRPKLIDGLKIMSVEIPEISPSEILTPEEVVFLAQEAGKRRDEMKCLILTLYESSARISEVLSLKLGDCIFSTVFDKEGNRKLIATLYFKRSKGGIKKSPVTCVMFAADIQKWVQNHPCKGDERAWLFPSPVHPGEPISQGNVADVLWYAAQRTGLKKRCNPHFLRHSSLSWFANSRNYSDVMLGIRAGWSPGSPMSQRYVHTSSEIEKSLYLERMGLIEGVKEPEKKILPKTCPNCQSINSYLDSICSACCMPLDPEEYQKEIEKRRNIEQLYRNLQDISRKHLTEEQEMFLTKRVDTVLGLLEIGRDDLAREYIFKLLENWTRAFLTA
jgi:integrase